MRVGGGINFVVGKQGDGKTYYAVKRQILPTLLQRRYVVTNVQLGWMDRHKDFHAGEGWAEYVAYMARPFPWQRGARRAIVNNLRRYYLFVPDLEDAIRLRPPREHGREAAGRWVWDELHNDLGNRTWNAEGREELVHRFTHYRKNGWAAFLLTQHPENTDKSVRRVANNVVMLRNQKERTRLLGMRVTPWPLFLAMWYPALSVTNAEQVKGQPDRIERYFLGGVSRCYDSWASVASHEGDLEWDELPAAGFAPARGLPAAAPKALG